ncbi:repair XRCC1 [Octopus vulgaris]|uniref:Repair XRCC1 n=1 Tax=Octopus vulgaris TaxID=6645 RepID=A0AA36AGD0_OCTVU|nr:repair XRCC1 [Octopus vulgaris]
MARHVALKYVVSFTSQDETHSVQNLLKDGCFKKWLSNPKDRTGIMEGVFQLDQASVISYLDIGSHMCSNIEIRVGKSDWPQSRQFEPLIRNINLMTLSDVQLGRNVDHTSMFSTKDFCPAASNGVWDRIHVICRQIYRKNVQFGLSFIRIKSKHVDSSSQSPKQTAEKDISKKISNEMIQQHFFKSKQPSVSENEKLKSQLLKLSSGEGGPESVQGLSRTAQMLLAAKENVGKYSPETRYKSDGKTKNNVLFSETAAQRQNLTIEEEMDLFISKLKINRKQLHSVTIADLRHQFEKRKKRKLTVEERSTYATKVTDHINSVFSLRDLHKKEKVIDQKEEEQQSKRLKIEHRNHNTTSNNMPLPSAASTSKSNFSNLQHKATNSIETKETQEGLGDFQLVMDMSEDLPKTINTENQNLNTSDNNFEPLLQNANFLNSSEISSGKLEAMTIKKDSFALGKTRHTKTSPKNSFSSSRDHTATSNTDIGVDLEEMDSDCVSCPLCGELFPGDVIEMHANVCADSQLFELNYSP